MQLEKKAGEMEYNPGQDTSPEGVPEGVFPVSFRTFGAAADSLQPSRIGKPRTR